MAGVSSGGAEPPGSAGPGLPNALTAKLKGDDELEGRELSIGLMEVLNTQVATLTATLKERDRELAKSAIQVDTLKKKLTAELEAGERKSARLKSMRESHELQLGQEAAARNQLEARLKAAEESEERWKARLDNERAGREEAEAKLLHSQSDREKHVYPASMTRPMVSNTEWAQANDLVKMAELAQEVQELRAQVEAERTRAASEKGQRDAAEQEVASLMMELGRLQSSMSSTCNEAPTATDAEATILKLSQENAQLRAEQGVVRGSHSSLLSEPADTVVSSGDKEAPNTGHPDGFPGVASRILDANLLRMVQLRRHLLEELLSRPDGAEVAEGCFARVMTPNRKTYSLLQVVGMDAHGADEDWTKSVLWLEDGGSICAGLVSRKAASAEEVAALLNRIGDNKARAQAIVVKAGQLHSLHPHAITSESPSSHSYQMTLTQQDARTQTTHHESRSRMSSLGENLHARWNDESEGPDYQIASALQNQLGDLQMEVTRYKQDLADKLENEKALREELLRSHQAQAMIVAELDAQLKQARHELSDREADENLIAVRLLEVVSATARQAEQLQQQKLAQRQWDQQLALGIQEATMDLSERLDHEQTRATEALEAAQEQAVGAQKALLAERSQRMTLQGSLEALQQQLVEMEEARTLERVQWETRIADAADQAVASSADREELEEALAAAMDRANEEARLSSTAQAELQAERDNAQVAFERQLRLERELEATVLQAELKIAEAIAARDKALKRLETESGQTTGALEAWAEAAREQAEREQLLLEKESLEKKLAWAMRELVYAQSGKSPPSHGGMVSASPRAKPAIAAKSGRSYTSRQEDEMEVLEWLERGSTQSPSKLPDPPLEMPKQKSGSPSSPSAVLSDMLLSLTVAGGLTPTPPPPTSRPLPISVDESAPNSHLSEAEMEFLAVANTAFPRARRTLQYPPHTTGQQGVHSPEPRGAFHWQLDELVEEKEELRSSLAASDLKVSELRASLSDAVEHLMEAEAKVLQQRGMQQHSVLSDSDEGFQHSPVPSTRLSPTKGILQQTLPSVSMESDDFNSAGEGKSFRFVSEHAQPFGQHHGSMTSSPPAPLHPSPSDKDGAFGSGTSSPCAPSLKSIVDTSNLSACIVNPASDDDDVD